MREKEEVRLRTTNWVGGLGGEWTEEDRTSSWELNRRGRSGTGREPPAPTLWEGSFREAGDVEDIFFLFLFVV